jgi:hypothetical protein
LIPRDPALADMSTLEDSWAWTVRDSGMTTERDPDAARLVVGKHGPAAPPVRCAFTVISGAGLLPVGHVLVFAVGEDRPATLGRATHADICLRDPAISRAACHIRLAADRLLLTDTGASGSISVNGGARWPIDQPLGDGDIVEAGAFRLRFAVLGAGAHPA